MFLLVCRRVRLPGTKRSQSQEIKLGKCDSVLVTRLPERKREPLLTGSVLENICLGSGSPPAFLLRQPHNVGWRLARDRNRPRLLS